MKIPKKAFQITNAMCCALFACAVASVAKAENMPTDDRAKISAILAQRRPETAEGLASQADSLSALLPNRLQPGRRGETELVLEAGKILERLVTSFQENASLRSPATVKALARPLLMYDYALKQVENHAFSPLPVTTNVVPPDGSGIPAGGSPEGIQDPVKRELYKSMMAENESNSEINRMHAVLGSQVRLTTSLMRNLLNASGDDDKLLDKAMRAKLTDSITP